VPLFTSGGLGLVILVLVLSSSQLCCVCCFTALHTYTADILARFLDGRVYVEKILKY